MTDAPLSILHVLAPADSGGLETVVRSLALGHSNDGLQVAIAAVLESASNPFVEEARDSGLTVHVIQSAARSIRPERRAVRALMTQNSVNVLHSHGYRSDILDIGMARGMHVPSVTTLHGFSATDRKARLYEWLQLRAARRASAIVAVSTNVANRILASGAKPASVHLIRNAAGVVVSPVERSAARARLGLNDDLNVGWIGRLSREKAPDVMVAAMRYLSDLPLTLSFVGDGPDLAALSAQASDLGLGHRVRFLGRISDAATLLRAFDAVVLSSRTEGTPMVLLEAMGAGVPIVATRVGGVPDMLSDEQALLVNPEDPEALGIAIRRSLLDPAAAIARSALARARLDTEFSNHAWLQRYASLYRSIQPAVRRTCT